MAIDYLTNRLEERLRVVCKFQEGGDDYTLIQDGPLWAAVQSETDRKTLWLIPEGSPAGTRVQGIWGPLSDFDLIYLGPGEPPRLDPS